jgi:hypothetical protein
MRRKVWLFVIFAIIVFAQVTVLDSFFHSFQASGFTYNTSVVEVGKMNYAYGWASITVTGSTGTAQLPNGTIIRLNPILQFSNRTQIIVNSTTFTFKMVFPRTGDCFTCSGGTGLFGNNGQTLASLDPSHPIVAAVVSNASSFFISTMPESGSTMDSLFQYYWFIIQGDASVSLNGYGVAY